MGRSVCSARASNGGRTYLRTKCHLDPSNRLDLVDLGPGDIVLDGDPTPPKGHIPNFWPMSVVAKRLDGSRYQDATWYGGRPPPGRHCVRWGSRSPL